MFCKQDKFCKAFEQVVAFEWTDGRKAMIINLVAGARSLFCHFVATSFTSILFCHKLDCKQERKNKHVLQRMTVREWHKVIETGNE